MSLKDTYKHMKDLLSHITMDLEKAESGNKAASQRVRTGTVKLEKLAKLYRKESISSEKKTKGQKKAPKSASKSAKAAHHPSKAHGAKAKTASHAVAKSSAKVKAKPKAKAMKASVRPRQLSIKRATAKLPTRRASAR